MKRRYALGMERLVRILRQAGGRVSMSHAAAPISIGSALTAHAILHSCQPVPLTCAAHSLSKVCCQAGGRVSGFHAAAPISIGSALMTFARRNGLSGRKIRLIISRMLGHIA